MCIRDRYDGVRLAGLYPHKQVKLVEKAGAHVFGPVVNTNTRRSTAWNVARAVTFVKACCEAATIPIHANVGMGGISTAGEVVAMMQLQRKMRLPEAKAYVADKLRVSTRDLSDEVAMRELREELDIGVVTSVPGAARGLEAKARISDLLGVTIPSVERLKRKVGGIG